MVQGAGILTLHCVPTLPGKSRVFASLYTAAKTVPLPLRVIFRHFVCGWWEHTHGGLTILDGDAQLILGQVRLPQPLGCKHTELITWGKPLAMRSGARYSWQERHLSILAWHCCLHEHLAGVQSAEGLQALVQSYANMEEKSPKTSYYMPAQADRWALAPTKYLHCVHLISRIFNSLWLERPAEATDV